MCHTTSGKKKEKWTQKDEKKRRKKNVAKKTEEQCGALANLYMFVVDLSIMLISCSFSMNESIFFPAVTKNMFP